MIHEYLLKWDIPDWKVKQIQVPSTQCDFLQVNICIVNIDNGSINVPEDLPCFPQHDELANELREVLTKLQRPPAKTNTST